jgi:Chaperone of endosialidase
MNARLLILTCGLIFTASSAAAQVVTPGTSCAAEGDGTGGLTAFWEQSSICPSSTLIWQRPAFQFGPAIASCATSTAGMVEWASSALKYCDGSTWVTIGGSNNSTFSAGSASGPGWAVTGDADTGLFEAVANTLSIAAGGKEIARFDNSASASFVNYFDFAGSTTGNSILESAAGSDTDISIAIMPKGAGAVGIGTTLPNNFYALDVDGAAYFAESVTSTDIIVSYTNTNTVYSPTSTSVMYPDYGLAAVNTATIDGEFGGLIVDARDAAGNDNNAYFGVVSTPASFTPTIVIGQQIGSTSYQERMRIDESGKLAIGTTTANHLLDVNGNIGIVASGYLNFGTIDASSGYGIRDNGGTIECKNSGGSWSACQGSGSTFLAGTVSAPGWAVSGDTDTGLFQAAFRPNTLSIAAGGVEAARFETATGAVNYLDVTPGVASPAFNAVFLSALGSDTDIDLALTAKGAGSIVAYGSLVVVGTPDSWAASFQTDFGNTGASNNNINIVNLMNVNGNGSIGDDIDFSANYTDHEWGLRNDYNGSGGHNFELIDDTSNAYPLFVNSNDMVAIGTTSANAHLYISGNVSDASWMSTGKALAVAAATFTDTTGSGTKTRRVAVSFAQPTFASSSAVTVTDAATLYIPAAPAAGTNTTFTNSWAQYIGAGNAFFGGNIHEAASGYINFGSTDGSSGYGIRDHSGTIECKNSGGSWSACQGSGGSTFAAGTVTAPGWAVTGDTDTGLFEAVANTLSIAAGGKEIARFDNNSGANFVDYLDFQGSVTGSPGIVGILAGGSDSDVSIGLIAKGTGAVTVGSNFFVNNAQMAVYAPTAVGDSEAAVFSSSSGATDITLNNGNAISAESNILFDHNGSVVWAITNDFNEAGNQDFSIFDGVANAVRLWIDSSGEVGIGTTTANHLLDVNGNIGILASGYLNFGTTDGSSGYGIRDHSGTIECKNSGGSWSACQGSGGSTFAAGTVTAPGWAVSGDTDTGLFEAAANTLSIAAGGKEIARFDNNASASFVDYFDFAGSTSSNHTITLAATGSDTDISIALAPKGLGRIGIGTTVMPGDLNIQNAGDEAALAMTTPSTGQNIEMDMESAGAVKWRLMKDISDILVIQSGSGSAGSESFTNQLLLQNNNHAFITGILDIGPGFGGNQLTVTNNTSGYNYATAQFLMPSGGADENFIDLSNNNGGASINNAISFQNGSWAIGNDTNGDGEDNFSLYHGATAKSPIYVDTTDQVLIGTYAGTVHHTLEVAGNIGVATSGYVNFGTADSSGGYGIRDNSGAMEFKNSGGAWGAFATASDQRLKRDIVDLSPQDGLAAILKLRPVRFHWKDVGKDKVQGEQIGLIAQEVEKIFPFGVTGNFGDVVIDLGNGQKETVQQARKLDYDKLVAPVIKAIQELDGALMKFVSAPTIGSPAHPTGITLYDDVTGEPYCVHMHSGSWMQEHGECKTVNHSRP